MRQSLRHSVKREPPFEPAVSVGQIEVIPLGRKKVKALDGDAVAQWLRGEGEVVAHSLSPADGAACEIDSIKIVIPVHRIDHGERTARSHRDVTHMRSEPLIGRRPTTLDETADR